MRITILDDALDDLYAGIHRIVYGFHRSLSKRFPFAIYYDVKNDCVRVFAVLDGRQDPTAIRKRLSGPRSRES